MMLRKLFLIQILLFSILIATSQNVSIKLLDEETGESVPFATIQFSELDGVMSNEEGLFTIQKSDFEISRDSLSISCMGYQKQSVFKKYLSENDTIKLTAKVFEISPVVLSSKKIPVSQIIKNVKDKVETNYITDNIKYNIFLRENYYQKQNKWDLKVKQSTIKELDQHAIDTIFNKIPKEFITVNESYSKFYLGSDEQSKTQIQKIMHIRSKHQQFSTDNMQKDFYNALQKNMKGNSYLVIKTGIIRLDKTESIDSILTEMKEGQEKKYGDYAETIQKNRNKSFRYTLDKLFIHPKSKQDYIHKSYKYDFELIEFSEINNDLVYVIDFRPKSKAKYKGRLYIDTETFAVVRADVEGAQDIFDKHFNMFGISSSTVNVSKTILFEKNKDSQYYIKYYKSYSSYSQGVKRDFKIIEKNKIIKGKNKQNQLDLAVNIKTYLNSKWEMVFTNPQSLSSSEFTSFKTKDDYILEEFTSYPKTFWNGYNILTPEKAIQELKIED